MASYLFPDNSVVITFACVDELEILKNYLGGRGRVVEAVSREIEVSTPMTPNLSGLDQEEWFGEPIAIKGSRRVRAVEGLRTAVFGGTKAKPLEHLGESQTLHVLKHDREFHDSLWLTEDSEAYKFAVAQQIVTRDVFGVLNDLVGFAELTSSDAFALSVRMFDAGRPLRRQPTAPSDFG